MPIRLTKAEEVINALVLHRVEVTLKRILRVFSKKKTGIEREQAVRQLAEMRLRRAK